VHVHQTHDVPSELLPLRKLGAAGQYDLYLSPLYSRYFCRNPLNRSGRVQDFVMLASASRGVGNWSFKLRTRSACRQQLHLGPQTELPLVRELFYYVFSFIPRLSLVKYQKTLPSEFVCELSPSLCSSSLGPHHSLKTRSNSLLCCDFGLQSPLSREEGVES